MTELDVLNAIFSKKFQKDGKNDGNYSCNWAIDRKR